MRKYLLAIVASLVLAAIPAVAQTKLEVSHFPGATWPIAAATAQGYFAKEKLAIHLDPVTSSVAQIKGMMDGTDDLGLTALDNVIAYDAGQGEAKLGSPADLFAFMGGEGGSMHLIAAPAIKTVASLKGKTLAVDAKSTGFAFLLYRVAAMHGVKPGDYSLIAVGSSQKRLAALTGGQAQATLLNRPFDGFATAKGFNDLVDMRKVFPHYQSSVGMARRAWAAQHRDTLIAFIRAYVKGSLWLFDPTHKAEAIALLLKNTPKLSPQQAESIYRATTAKGGATSPTAKLDPAGIAAVVRLRSAYAEPKKKLNARDFYDLSYYKAAVK
ncbi:MAG TPA: ABC transporter substrate-binding protein [Stellaceae bacterium]|nr:ABC transporter substrate-binding protein [Stellaceae bacterium]